MSTITKRKLYDEDFKRNAVKILLESGKPVTSVADDIGVNQSMLHKWKNKYAAYMDNDAEPGKDVLSLRREIAVIKENVSQLRSAVEKLLEKKYADL
jgi:transposase-like protein